MRATRLLPIGANTFQIHIDANGGGELYGLVYGRELPEPTPFSGLSGLIVMLENLMDIGAADGPEKDVPSNFAPNMELEVLFRQNYSWQGKIRWLELQREAAFRSVLELIILLKTTFSE